ncbi:EAL domain-containing protein [Mesorhizobium sp. CAU 1741]|uniref:bifunctional diguanylate cyclase/phosphodiesterase n=1 Tax=Mesorhizobium sp. CAU 1741 TaxID=3140366 RepID=UPI00325AC7D3
MNLSLLRRRRAFGRLFRKTNIPAILALVVILTAGLLADRQQHQTFEQNQRAEVLGHVSVLRAKLEGNINSNIQLVRGLVATLATEPQMSQERFGQLASNLLRQKSQIRHVAAAPDLIVSLIYPLVGNENALGLNYRRSEAQRGAALRARDTGEMILAGPMDLVQGGRGFIARFPVFSDPEGGIDSFWGIVSAIIDVDQLYVDSGLLDANLPIEITLTGRNATGGRGARFLGPADILEDRPVVTEVVLPSGSWQIAARPRGGWSANPPGIWYIRALMLFAGALIMVPTVLTGRLMHERQRNIGELRRRERQLERLSHRLRLALDTSKVAVWEMTLGDAHEYWDDRMNELYGYPADGAPRDHTYWEKRVHPDDLARAQREFGEALENRGSYTSRYRIVLDNGRIRHVRAIGTIYDVPGAQPKMVGVNWDVTADVSLNEELKRVNALTEARNIELESAKARIEHNALHDSLTGLPNRRHLDEVLANHASRFERGEEAAALLQIDLDRFKQINDTLGHIAGDAMLVHAAAILKTTVNPDDFVARIGGDEFVVVRRWPTEKPGSSLSSLTCLAENIIDRMQSPMNYQGHECRVGVSIGIATDMDSVADPRRLLVNADIALYRAKSRGRNRHQFFNDALQAEIINTKRVADDILSGLEQNQFVAHYQPQFDAETLEVIGVEALARWRHPTEGLLAPAAFMKIAEELNVVATIDRMILEQALLDFNIWESSGLHIPKVSVNVSARRLHDEELIGHLRQMNIRPGSIAFELVESIFLDENDELLTWNVDQIKELGIDIEIDDFGTGYASIVSLMKLKPRRLKIDRQFIQPIVNSPGQRQLVGSIIEIGKSLGIEVLAEGVETMEHARLLRQLGCNALQGYAFARPLSSSDLVEFVQSRRWRKAS